MSSVCALCQMRRGPSLFIGRRWWRYCKEYSPLINAFLSSPPKTNHLTALFSGLAAGWSSFWGRWRASPSKLGSFGLCEGSTEPYFGGGSTKPKGGSLGPSFGVVVVLWPWLWILLRFPKKDQIEMVLAFGFYVCLCGEL